MNLIPLLKDPYYFFILLSVVNILFYLLTLLFSSYWGCSNKQQLKKKSLSDFALSLFILFVNIAVAIPGYALFYWDIIKFDYTFSFASLFADLFLLLVVVDFIMYVAHLSAHRIDFLKKVHERHHTHHEFNELSLYVLHPFEAIGLGLLFTFLFCLYDFNIYAVVLFLLLNWFWGVIAHLNVAKVSIPKFFSNNLFHAIHHKTGAYNLGFYTVLWDKLFKTYRVDI